MIRHCIEGIHFYYYQGSPKTKKEKFIINFTKDCYVIKMLGSFYKKNMIFKLQKFALIYQ